MRRGTKATWQSPGGPHGSRRRTVARPRGRRLHDHAVHVGPGVGRHVARLVSGGPTGIVGPGK